MHLSIFEGMVTILMDFLVRREARDFSSIATFKRKWYMQHLNSFRIFQSSDMRQCTALVQIRSQQAIRSKSRGDIKRPFISNELPAEDTSELCHDVLAFGVEHGGGKR